MIGEMHTFADWGLYLIDRSVTLPDVKTNNVDVPGRNGALDLSEALDGEAHFGNRTVSLTLGSFERLNKKTWSQMLKTVGNYVHGQKQKIVLDEDRDYYYEGRGKIDSFEWDCHGRQQFALLFDCQPFRTRVAPSVATKNLTTTDVVIPLVNDGRPITPTIECTAETVLTWQGSSIALSAGTHTVPAIRLPNGRSELTAKTKSGIGKITIRWNEVTI